MEDYRRRIADIEGQIASQKTDEKVTFNMTDMGEIWTTDIRTVEGIDYELCNRLDEERRRFDWNSIISRKYVEIILAVICFFFHCFIYLQ